MGLRKLTTFPVSDQDGLYHKISEDGNALMSDGDEVVAAEGVYQCGTCHGSGDYDSIMYYMQWLNGVIRCETDELECKLDGEGSRRVMNVYATAGGTLSLRGFHIHRGKNVYYGGGLYMSGEGIVILSIMRFTKCQATYSQSGFGGGAIFAESGTINLYAVEFSGNSASTNNGNDIYTYGNGAAVTIHSTCPTDMLGGTPTQGESLPACSSPLSHQPIPSPLPLCIVAPSPSGTALDTYIDPDAIRSGTITGLTNSYSKGTCAKPSYLCPAGSSNPTEGETSDSCVPCSAGESSSSGSTSCTPCDAGTYSGASSSSCTPCAAGKYLVSATTSSEADACSDCSSGSYSGASSSSCTACAAGKYFILSTTSSEPEACSTCSAGSYSTDPGSLECTTCPAGSYSGVSSSSCSPCAAGKYLVSAATSSEADACSDCVSGSYSGVSSSNCTACAAGKYFILSTTSREAEACSLCCPPGTFIDGSSCVLCPVGRYAEFGGET